MMASDCQAGVYFTSIWFLPIQHDSLGVRSHVCLADEYEKQLMQWARCHLAVLAGEVHAAGRDALTLPDVVRLRSSRGSSHAASSCPAAAGGAGRCQSCSQLPAACAALPAAGAAVHAAAVAAAEAAAERAAGSVGHGRPAKCRDTAGCLAERRLLGTSGGCAAICQARLGLRKGCSVVLAGRVQLRVFQHRTA